MENHVKLFYLLHAVGSFIKTKMYPIKNIISHKSNSLYKFNLTDAETLGEQTRISTLTGGLQHSFYSEYIARRVNRWTKSLHW